MAYSGLIDFVDLLERVGELHRITTFTDPVLEITEITDRITKNKGKALLFENNGTNFPVLINAFGSDKRMAMALGKNELDDIKAQYDNIIKDLSGKRDTLFRKVTALPALFRLSSYLPASIRGKGRCQEVIHSEPDLNILPVLKCWPHDGGRFITLPIVHTIHPETGNTNAGMYRMQLLDKKTTAIHWQRHKTGANHFEAWKRIRGKMPVSVALGGDPVYTYAATAPLPENIDEYILAGFLRKKKVKMVKCLTNQLCVPEDADIIIEGYVDPSEDNVWEGPFGDHTGFYSLADWYPIFHVTCITHAKKAVYPATIVGIPPQEDAWIAKATEKIFLTPVKLTLQQEIEDFHMPDAGVAHNLMIVKISKSYPGQGMKVINSLFGAGQMMFTKYLIVVSGNINIRKYEELLVHIFENTDLGKDLIFSRGPLDVLDHSSDNYSFGGKLGIDATVKHKEEISYVQTIKDHNNAVFHSIGKYLESGLIKSYNSSLCNGGIPLLIISVNRSEDKSVTDKVKNLIRINDTLGIFRLILAVDHTVDTDDLYMVAWQILGNSDPYRDHEYLASSSLFIDGTIKAYREGGFTRKWPNIVCSGIETIEAIDKKWESMGIGEFIHSPSLRYSVLCRNGKDEIVLE